MSSNTYVNVALVVGSLEKQLGITGVKYEALARTNARGSKYQVLNFMQSDNTPICNYVYAKATKDGFIVLAKSFKEKMTKRDKIIETASNDDLLELLFE